MGHKIYTEIVSSLNQAKCTQECHDKNIGGRMTAILLDSYSYDELSAIVSVPATFAENMVNALEVLEEMGKTQYVIR